ncbi:MAG: transposase [Hyphomicrobiales bacterium]|nr:transposase [Hyphomicrobiales bacterium]
MARLARLVVPALPHHVTQRGNRCGQTLFEDGDYQLYRDLLADAARKAGTQIWCYCLMPNHVHIIVTPGDEDGLHRTFSDAHRRYTGYINARMRVTGHLWQGRFGSVVMDEEHLFHAVRYVLLNPVRAGLAKRPQDWKWSSARAHLAGRDDDLVDVSATLQRYGDFDSIPGDYTDADSGPGDEMAFIRLRQSETTGRPLGSNDWLKQLEQQSGRILRPQKRGLKTGRRVNN